MKNVIKFICFIIYTTSIFFIYDNFLLFAVLLLNIFIMLIFHISIIETIRSLVKYLPFVLFTTIINWILSNHEYAIFISIKLLLVCNITYIYSKINTVREIAITIKTLCKPLKLLNVNIEEIELLVCISLSMLSILKKEYSQIKVACLAKGMDINIKNIKLILMRFMVCIMKRVNEIEESIIEKGYGEV